MRKNLLKLLALFLLAVSLAACGLLPEKIDETASWPAGKLYREAKDEMRSGNYEKAIEYYEKLESRYPFGVFAQQAQIDIAYAYYRDNEPAQALAAVERFIKLHPNHPNINYMYYLRGLINFNDRVGLLNFAFRQDSLRTRSESGAGRLRLFQAAGHPVSGQCLFKRRHIPHEISGHDAGKI